MAWAPLYRILILKSVIRHRNPEPVSAGFLIFRALQSRFFGEEPTTESATHLPGFRFVAYCVLSYFALLLCAKPLAVLAVPPVPWTAYLTRSPPVSLLRV